MCYSQSIELKQKQADSLFEKKEYQSAALLYMELYKQNAKLSKNKGEIVFSLARTYHRSGELEKAKIYCQESSLIFQELKLWNDFYEVQSALARISENNGQHEEAIKICKRTIDYYKQIKDTVKIIKETYNLAFYHYYAGKIQAAIDYYTQTIKLAENIDAYTQAMCYNELGTIWAVDLNNEEKALEYYKKSLQLKLKINVPDKSIAFSYSNIGISHKNLGRMDSAMYYYQLALNYAEKSNEPMVKVQPLINIANLQKKQGNFEVSVQTFGQILKMTDYVTIRQKINIYTNLGILYNQLKEYQKAIANLIIAEGLTKETNDLIDRADVQEQKAIAYLGLKNFEKAYQAMEIRTLLKDSIHQREKEQELTDILLKYETAEKDKTISEQNLLIAQKENMIIKRNMGLITVILLSIIAAIIVWFVLHRRNVKVQIEEEQKMNRVIFESEQKERIRIARDLHDSIGQKLSVMKMLLSKNDETKNDIKKITNYLDETATEVRSISHNLVPEILNLGFVKAMENLIEQINEGKKINAELQISDEIKKILLPYQTEISLYRIIQEIIGNIVRHSKTESIFIEIISKENFMRILIQDKGVGFDTQTVDESESLGWKNIFARIKLVQGQIKLKSQPGSGSEFLIKIPIV